MNIPTLIEICEYIMEVNEDPTLNVESFGIAVSNQMGQLRQALLPSKTIKLLVESTLGDDDADEWIVTPLNGENAGKSIRAWKDSEIASLARAARHDHQRTLRPWRTIERVYAVDGGDVMVTLNSCGHTVRDPEIEKGKVRCGACPEEAS